MGRDPRAREAIVTVEETWTRICLWAEAYAPEALRTLNGPASEDELAALEATGLVPRDLLRSLALHNGAGLRGPLPVYLMSANEMLEAWRGLNRTHVRPIRFFGPPPVDEQIRPIWWHSHWMPFTDNGAGDHLCCDADPDPSGSPGQVVTYFHDLADRRVAAPSFSEWLARQADALESGETVATEQDGKFYAVFRRADLFGSLADLTIRQTPVHDVPELDSSEVAWSLVQALQSKGQLRFADGVFVPGAMWPVADALNHGLHAAAIHRTIACAPGVSRLDASIDEINSLLDELT